MIKLITIGKIKEKYNREAILEYKKRISKFVDLEIKVLKEYTFGDIKKNLKKEEELILSNLDKKNYIIVLAIDGVKLTSLSLANKMNKINVDGYSDITFIIGSSHGLTETVKKKANLLLSFSDLTFPHQIFQVMLLEQIYRGFKINNNESYHKWVYVNNKF